MLKTYNKIIEYSNSRQTMSDKDLVNKKVYTRKEIYEFKAIARDIGYSSKIFKSSLIHSTIEVGLLCFYPSIYSILDKFAFLAVNALLVALLISLTSMGVCLIRLVYFRNAGIHEGLLFLVGYMSCSLNDFDKRYWG